MSLIEIIGEWISPGPTGSVDIRPPERRVQATGLLVAHALFSIAGLTLLLLFFGIPGGLGGILRCLAYVAVGTIVRPAPDLNNVGWLGGLIDHPFRWSDDINRFLVFLLIFLWPGRVIGSGLLSLLASLFRGARSAR